jgi:L-threonylcarbamoyladenylate synthase
VKAKIYKPTRRNLTHLANELKRGQLVAIPTETVYGLAADALNPAACAKIFKAKRRPANDPLIVHVLNVEEAEKIADLNPIARTLAKQFWPGALTLVLPKKNCVPKIVTSGGDTVAVRCPAHPVALSLLRIAKIPLAAPSANPFGYISPTEASHVIDGLGDRIEHVIDGGPCEIGVESTILDLSNPSAPKVLRPGLITAEQLQPFVDSKIKTPKKQRAQSNARQLAPGMLSRHYSPLTSLSFLSASTNRNQPDIGVIHVRKPTRVSVGDHWLSKRGSLREIARNLYSVLRAADAVGYKRIYVERLPANSGQLAVAINDRLRRATAKR